MFSFICKGIIRDRRRSLLPVVVVTIGVMVVVFLDGLMGGMMDNMVRMTANFQIGHLKVMTRAYAADEAQKPNDLALLGSGEVMEQLHRDYPEVDWTPRIFFGGLLDIPDEHGETKAQGPVTAQAADLLLEGSKEAARLGLEKAITAGHIITQPGEILVSIDFAESFGVKPGDRVTFFGSTMDGAMSFANYHVAGIVRFGNSMLDRGGVILDIADARLLLDMEDAAGEIFGFLPGEKYLKERAESIKTSFNHQQADNPDVYAPVMTQLMDQDMMRQTLGYTDSMSFFMLLLLMIALSIVLWNAGVLGGIRRYNEFGVRLAMGEEKRQLYRSLLTESLVIGIIGSAVGTTLGLLVCLLLSRHGLDYSAVMENIAMMIDPVIHTRITPRMYYIGAIPGILSMLVGTALAGQKIYKRNTALLFKELD